MKTLYILVEESTSAFRGELIFQILSLKDDHELLKFTICFIQQGENFLLLNREKPTWMGSWNAVGGKIEPNENPRESVLREVREETGILLDQIQFKGIVTWVVDGSSVGGMYAYYAEIPTHDHYETPIKTEEGILDWKKKDWILHPENTGIVNNIPRSLHRMMGSGGCFEHRCYYENGHLIHDEFFDIHEDVEFATELNTMSELLKVIN